MAEPAQAISQVIFGQWSLAGIGTAIDMNARLAEDPEFAQGQPAYGTDFFDLSAGAALGAQAIFLVVFVGVTAAAAAPPPTRV